MSLTGGIAVNCSDSSRRGGTESHLWITDVESIDSFTAGSSHDYSAVALTSTNTFRKYEIEHFTMSLSSTGTKENGSSVITHEVEFTIPKMSKEKAAKLQEVVDLCKAVIIFGDNNGKYWVLGWDETIGKSAGLDMVVNQVIGQNLGDSNHYVISGVGISTEMSREYTGDTTDAADFDQTAA